MGVCSGSWVDRKKSDGSLAVVSRAGAFGGARSVRKLFLGFLERIRKL